MQEPGRSAFPSSLRCRHADKQAGTEGLQRFYAERKGRAKDKEQGLVLKKVCNKGRDRQSRALL